MRIHFEQLKPGDRRLDRCGFCMSFSLTFEHNLLINVTWAEASFFWFEHCNAYFCLQPQNLAVPFHIHNW